MDLDFVPDITMRGEDDPHGRVIAERPPTVGQLAALIHEHTRRPGDWWHLVRFDPAGPAGVRIDGAGRLGSTEGLGDVELWLTAWPPGHRAHPHDHDATEVAMLLAGELTEVTISPDGATERPLRANRVRVFAGRGRRNVAGDGHLRELVNPGSTFAITLHVLSGDRRGPDVTDRGDAIGSAPAPVPPRRDR